MEKMFAVIGLNEHGVWWKEDGVLKSRLTERIGSSASAFPVHPNPRTAPR